jgi:DNA (cytosine-5)-methyltransferase 1
LSAPAAGAVELFCGIGGFASAWEGPIVAAFDQHPDAAATYPRLHGAPVDRRNLESIRAIPEAAVWWMSPPCQPFAERGLGLGLEDPRSRPLLHLLGLLRAARPRAFGLENVPPFADAPAAAAVAEAWGGPVRSFQLCPTDLGIPMRRRRAYLVGHRDGVGEPVLAPVRRPIPSILDPFDAALVPEARTLERFGDKLAVVDAEDEDAVAVCFTSAYGRSPVAAGPYLRQGGRIRRFSPVEIARLFGFGPRAEALRALPLRTGWALVGQSLSVDVVRVLTPLLRA